MDNFSPARTYAQSLDQADPLAAFRARFSHPQPSLRYMDGNSLGKLPLKTIDVLEQAVRDQWGGELIRGWNQGWWEAPQRIGDKIGQLVGAAPGQVALCDSTSVNLFKLANTALMLRPGRKKIISDTLNFPSDLYILQGAIHTLQKGHSLHLVGSQDEDLTPDLQSLYEAIDEDTALVTLSHVVFKSGYLYDMAEITRRAHQKGALVLWDLSHSAGVFPVELDACEADLAIGCTYKYLNGGPGAPAFLYVNNRLQQQAVSPIWGWAGQDKPFNFALEYTPTPGIRRFVAGTPHVLSSLAVESGVEISLEAGMPAIREKSIRMTEYFIRLGEALLTEYQFRVGSPREAHLRGGHVSLRHPEGYRINRALIDDMEVIPDFREPDNIRFGFAPLYTSYEEIWETVERLRIVMEEKRFTRYSQAKATVT